MIINKNECIKKHTKVATPKVTEYNCGCGLSSVCVVVVFCFCRLHLLWAAVAAVSSLELVRVNTSGLARGGQPLFFAFVLF